MSNELGSVHGFLGDVRCAFAGRRPAKTDPHKIMYRPWFVWYRCAGRRADSQAFPIRIRPNRAGSLSSYQEALSPNIEKLQQGAEKPRHVRNNMPRFGRVRRTASGLSSGRRLSSHSWATGRGPHGFSFSSMPAARTCITCAAKACARNWVEALIKFSVNGPKTGSELPGLAVCEASQKSSTFGA